MVETVCASRYSSAMLNFSPHTCRERIYPFRCDGFVGAYRSGNRKKRIGTSVNAPLKKCASKMPSPA
jgi:hypothetical protein